MHPLSLAALGATAVLGQDTLLPKPTGPYNVTVRTSGLIDHSRNESDPDAPTNQPRRMMVSMFSPISSSDVGCKSPYMLPGVAAVERTYLLTNEAPTKNFSANFNRFMLPACSVDVTDSARTPHTDELDAPKEQFPLLFYSLALGMSRFYYSVISQWLAATGFIVMTIDHPYTVDVVQFPNGDVVTANSNPEWSLSQYDAANEVRVADVRFVADQLADNATFSRLIYPACTKPNATDKIGILGHSFGGATAAQAMYEDKRFKGRLNLDGSLFGTVDTHGLSEPFVLWGFQGHGRAKGDDPTWGRIWPKLTGFRRELNLSDSSHLTMSDMPLLADLYPFNKVDFGMLKGTRVIQIISVCARDFFAFVFKGRDLT